MDIGRYTKKNTGSANPYALEKKCMECGKVLDSRERSMFYPRFCSRACKERYIGRPLED